MSTIDEFDFNKRLHFLLMDVRPIDDAERQEKSLNNSFALSHGQLTALLKLFNLSDVAKRDLNNLEHIWGVFQGVRRDRESGEYKRDQISILLNIGNDRTTRLYIRPVRVIADREAILDEMSQIRNPAQLMTYLGDLQAASITRRNPGAGFKKNGSAKGGFNQNRGNGGNRRSTVSPADFQEHGSHRPFEGKLQGFQPRT